MGLDAYRPATRWFQHDPWGIHGLAHACRVLVWADRLANEATAAGEQVDVEVVRWAAALHDVGRHDDGRDPDHGKRSAEWLIAHPQLTCQDLSPAQREVVAYCCRWHVPPDGAAPELIPELRILKDADGLDRVRINRLDPALLRSDVARALEPAAWDLFRATYPLDGADHWQAVRSAALQRGLWR